MPLFDGFTPPRHLTPSEPDPLLEWTGEDQAAYRLAHIQGAAETMGGLARHGRDLLASAPGGAAGIATGLAGAARGSRLGGLQGALSGFQTGYNQVPGNEMAAEHLGQSTGALSRRGVSPYTLAGMDVYTPGPGELAAMKLFHASPHKFKRMKIDEDTYMTGEGTNLEKSHGWGGHLSHPDSPEVHTYYHNQFGGDGRLGVINTETGENYPEHLVEEIGEWVRSTPKWRGGLRDEFTADLDTLREAQGTYDLRIRELTEQMTEQSSRVEVEALIRAKETTIRRLQRVEADLERLDAVENGHLMFRGDVDAAHSYQTTVDVDEHELLREDVDWPEQSGFVREKLTPLREKYAIEPDGAWGGADIRRRVGERNLSEAGVHGQRFPDGPAKRRAERPPTILLGGKNLNSEALNANQKRIADDLSAYMERGMEPAAAIAAKRGQLTRGLERGRSVIGDEVADGLEAELADLAELESRSITFGVDDSTYNVLMFPGSEHLIGDMEPGPLSNIVKGGLKY